MHGTYYMNAIWKEKGKKPVHFKKCATEMQNLTIGNFLEKRFLNIPSKCPIISNTKWKTWRLYSKIALSSNFLWVSLQSSRFSLIFRKFRDNSAQYPTPPNTGFLWKMSDGDPWQNSQPGILSKISTGTRKDSFPIRHRYSKNKIPIVIYLMETKRVENFNESSLKPEIV